MEQRIEANQMVDVTRQSSSPKRFKKQWHFIRITTASRLDYLKRIYRVANTFA
jgi:hypothetical protein